MPSSSSTSPVPLGSPQPTAPSRETASGALSRELADFLVELSIALHKYAIYPASHPLLVTSVEGVVRRLEGLLIDRSAISIGIARKQLVIEGVATDGSHPLLLELAQKLHRHHLGAIKIVQGISREELSDALATLSIEASRMPRPLGLDTEQYADRWPHFRIFPLTYDKLELLDEEDGEPGDDSVRAGRAAQLWVGLARAALAAEPTESPGALEPLAVAKAIDEHQREQAYDQVIVGYLLQIANELKTTDGAESAALQKRISKLVGGLQPETLKRLLEMGGDRKQRRRFILDAAQGMNVDAIVELVKAAADTEKQTISHSMVRLLSKLAQHADSQGESVRRRIEADRSLREAVGKLMSEWTLDDPNPEAYRAVLESVSRGVLVAPHNVDVTECEPERLVQMGLEVGTLGAQVWRAVEQMTTAGHLASLLDMLDAAPDRAVAEGVWRHLVKREMMRDLLDAERVDFTLVERLVRHAGPSAPRQLLDAIDATDDAKTRERLFDILAKLGGATAGELVVLRLDGARPALQRELLAFLGRLSAMPDGLDLSPFRSHSDAAVRREAVKLLLRHEHTRDETLMIALTDSDERTVYMALQAALERCPHGAVEVLRSRVERGELTSALRVLAIRVIATVRTPATLEWLKARVLTYTKWLRKPKLQPATPEVVAALAAIKAGWSNDANAASVLALAKKQMPNAT